MQASDGNLYGTTSGGTGPNQVFTWGTVFGMTPAGQLTTLHSFDVTDGANPDLGLVEDTNGNLYGETYFGGTQYNGTIFSLPVGLDRLAEKQTRSRKTGANINTPRPDRAGATGVRFSGNLAVFSGLPGTKSRTLELAVAAARSTKATSTTAKARSFTQDLTTVLDFDGANGALPYFASLIQGADGNLYGTTEGGGTFDQGNVFQVTPGGTLTTLYTFCSQTNCTDGAEPFAGLVQASNGKFYGTTTEGGANGAAGTVFEITSGGQLTTLYNFCSQPDCADGVFNEAPLVQANNGNLYGTTAGGGADGEGTVFEMTPAGQLTTLYSFCSQANCSDGANPYAGLLQASNGNLYGTTAGGGASGAGDRLPDYAGGPADHPLQLLFPTGLHRRHLPLRGASTSRQREPLRNDPFRRGKQRRHGL